MIKVIRAGNGIKQIKCKKCSSILEYEPNDIQKHSSPVCGTSKFITCPICGDKNLIQD